MIVSVIDSAGSVTDLYENVAAVVHEGDGWIRVCRDGQEDELVQNLRIVVTA